MISSHILSFCVRQVLKKGSHNFWASRGGLSHTRWPTLPWSGSTTSSCLRSPRQRRWMSRAKTYHCSRVAWPANSFDEFFFFSCCCWVCVCVCVCVYDTVVYRERLLFTSKNSENIIKNTDVSINLNFESKKISQSTFLYQLLVFTPGFVLKPPKIKRCTDPLIRIHTVGLTQDFQKKEDWFLDDYFIQKYRYRLLYCTFL